MENLKQAKASKGENGFDMISNLPDPILELILSCIPIDEVVRTSILSKQWRYIWKSIPSFPLLNIDYSPRRKSTKFQEFVSWAIENKPHLDLDSFRLSCLNYYDYSMLQRWIQAAFIRNVKSLDLRLYSYIFFPRCLETCESLEVLRLYLFTRPISLLEFKVFPALRVLDLNNVKLCNNHLVNELLRNSPLLEELSLIDCLTYRLGVLCISCPNLKTLRIYNLEMLYPEHLYFDFHDGDILREYEEDDVRWRIQLICPKLVLLEYAGHPACGISSEKLHFLKKVVFYPEDIEQKELLFESMMCKFFMDVSNVESLSLNHYFIQAINAASDPERNFPASFPNLKTFELTTTIDAFTMNLVVIHILTCSPNLESLHLIIQEDIFWLEDWEFNEILTRHLKRVNFLDFNGEKQKLGIVRLLLEHGNALEEMVFSWRDKVMYNEKSSETMIQVSKFYKASSAVKLINLLKD